MTQEEFFTGVSRPRNPEIMRIKRPLPRWCPQKRPLANPEPTGKLKWMR
jgi:hypothetical protein